MEETDQDLRAQKLKFRHDMLLVGFIVFLCLLTGYTCYHIGYDHAERKLETEAVHQGYGRYKPKECPECFEWKDLKDLKDWK
jgi:hypothetical protein